MIKMKIVSSYPYPSDFGGVAIEIDGIELLRYEDMEKGIFEECVLKDYLFMILEQWMRNIKRILYSSDELHLETFDNPWKYIFAPHNDEVSINFLYYGPRSQETNLKLMHKGKALKAKKSELIPEIFRVTDEFISANQKAINLTDEKTREYIQKELNTLIKTKTYAEEIWNKYKSKMNLQ